MDLLRRHAVELVEEWRAACIADLVRSGTTAVPDAGSGDEPGADRVHELITAAGPTVLAALAAQIQAPDQTAGPAPATAVANALVDNNVTVAVVVRQLTLLRDVLHRHARRHLPPESVAGAELQLTRAVDAAMVVCASRAAERLEEAAFVDHLTGLLNRRALERDLAREMAVAERHGRPLSVLTADLDGLKKINDRQGHTMGDQALRALGAALRGALRGGDSAYRVGGDEFVVILPEMGPDAIHRFVARVRSGAPPAFSWGAATFPDDVANRAALLDLADLRLLDFRRAAGRGGVRSGATSTNAAATAPPAPQRPRRDRRSLVVASFLGGLLLGGGGLASATTGTLPDPVQDVAHTVLAKVGVPVPPAKASAKAEARAQEAGPSPARFSGDALTPCVHPDGRQFSGTHGQYVEAHPDIAETPQNERELAAQSPCGKPVASVDGAQARPEGPGTPDVAGPPADAGKPESTGKPDETGRADPGVDPAGAGAPRDDRTTRTDVPGSRPGGGPSTTTTTTTTSATTTTTSTTVAPAQPVDEEPAVEPGARRGVSGTPGEGNGGAGGAGGRSQAPGKPAKG